ncbi:MAG TPA: carbamate kinase [Solirubrobacteraceae bacterium]|nr:carbamate kinase [Solirubrobacteraceae bacterium]
MRVVAALGGNALLRRGEPADAQTQRANVARAVAPLARVAREHELVVTHGNGPQVGLLALQGEAYSGVPAYPLDVLGAESEGMVGYLLDQRLVGELPQRKVATLLTQVIVDAADPAFAAPSKPIGPVYDREQAQRLARERGFAIAPDGRSWRRVVPSPEPRRIVEIEPIRILLEAGVIVICAGGGGVPVIEAAGGGLIGVEAVIDKDLAAALLARQLAADVLLLLTDVPNVELDWGTARGRPLRAASAQQIRGLGLAAGSMGPKAEAAARFAEGGGRAVIAATEQASDALSGEAGTQVGPRVQA